MNEPAPFPELSTAVEPLLEAYHDDLRVHDLNWIRNNPGIPFVHTTRNYGTHLIPLHPADSPEWPAPGLQVPYLFGHADRQHILNQKLAVAQYETREPRLAWHHWDGATLHHIDAERGLRIVQRHVDQVRRDWAKAARLPLSTAA